MNTITNDLICGAIAKLEAAPSEALRQKSPDYYGQLQGHQLAFARIKEKLPNSNEKQRLVKYLANLYALSIEDAELRNDLLRTFFDVGKLTVRQALWQVAVHVEQSIAQQRRYDAAYGDGAAACEYEARRRAVVDSELDDGGDVPVGDWRDRREDPMAGSGPELPKYERDELVAAFEQAHAWINAVMSEVLGAQGTEALLPNGLPYAQYKVDDAWYDVFSAEQAIERQIIDNRVSRVLREKRQLASRAAVLDKLAAM